MIVFPSIFIPCLRRSQIASRQENTLQFSVIIHPVRMYPFRRCRRNLSIFFNSLPLLSSSILSMFFLFIARIDWFFSLSITDIFRCYINLSSKNLICVSYIVRCNNEVQARALSCHIRSTCMVGVRTVHSSISFQSCLNFNAFASFLFLMRTNSHSSLHFSIATYIYSVFSVHISPSIFLGQFFDKSLIIISPLLF